MGVIRHKIWSDLWSNKSRTLQVVLIIAMGAFAIGMIIATRNLVITGMADSWRASSPAMIALWTSPFVDEDTLTALEGIQGVSKVEGFASTTIEWRHSPDDEWQPAGLLARDDYQHQQFATLDLLSGSWPQDNFFAVGQGGDVAFDIQQGDRIEVRINDRDRTMTVRGLIYDPNVQPPSFGGNAQFYTSLERYGELTGDEGFNRIMASAPVYDETRVTELADKIQDKLEKQNIESGGATPFGTRTSDPNKHFFQDTMDGIFMVLGVMAGLALILGLFLVYNTINAIISQQVDQIGVMKAIGAKTGNILWIYLVNVFVYGFLALFIAIPLGAVGGYALNVFLVNVFNGDPGPFRIDSVAIIAQVAIAILAPLAASLVPIFNGSRITVREAISTYGLNAGTGLLERGLAKLEQVSRLVLLTISNTFRNKGRVLLTQITLILSGLIFIMVMSVRDSASYTFGDVLFSILRFNVALSFENPERISRVEELSRRHPAVKAVEMWEIEGVSIHLASQPESDDDESATMFGVPLPTELYGPQLRAGRWLTPEDTKAVVLNQQLAQDAGVAIGDWVTFEHGFNKQTTWQVVGLLFDPIIPNSAHVPREVMLRELDNVGRASTVWIQTVRTDPQGEQEAARALREYYQDNQLDVSPSSIFGRDTSSEITAQVLNNFGVIVTLLATMAIVIGIVGSIALSGALSLNVLERRREIGVMRAIGASSGVIGGLFVGEGLILGLLSWVIALPLSIPASQLMTQALGVALQGEIVYHFTPFGATLWLVIIIILSIIASWFPARGATRISVRESLAYQ